ncbi:RNA polymerase sigma factor RpoD [Croceivirga lutea]|uniref:sigma-70 family RNA polymerase sigma factor n=1 Tax=Croceivirga lutea TaxID=1775167 RepID=UPI00163B4B88|nr:sigma-70 family RNA polymerase sigma factor [Croceivirga lutea]GGG38232.1 RNA polymerase sigma factor RpoD [Croceivirga lutea]
MKPLTISKQITNRDSPSLIKYLNDVGRIPMITSEEEVNLAVIIRQGDKKALEKLVSANLRFVVSVAKQYQFRGLILHDLINEGNLGLVKAAEKFDETRGFKFISYAVWWIRQGMIQAISEKSRIVRLPLNKLEALNKISSQFEQLNQREPSAQEISELTDLSMNEIQFCLTNGSSTLSMDDSLKNIDGELIYRDIMRSDSSTNPENKLFSDSMKSEIEKLLNILPSRESYIIKMCFGIGVLVPLTLNEIGSTLAITPERTRQLKMSALVRLRQLSSYNNLESYLD